MLVGQPLMFLKMKALTDLVGLCSMLLGHGNPNAILSLAQRRGVLHYLHTHTHTHTYIHTHELLFLFCLLQPLVSVGNVGQLTADLIISTLWMDRVGYILHDAITPAVGNNPFAHADATGCKLTSCCEGHRLLFCD